MPVLSDSDWESVIMPAVIKSEDTDCWYWFGSTNQKGHGCIWLNGKVTWVHRLSLERKLGREISPGCQANHLCYQNQNCVNPEHLYEGTRSGNAIDAINDGSYPTKVTAAQVVAIRTDKRKYAEIAKEYGIGLSQISKIKSRKTWKHIP
jgi:hypothetical protein